MRVVICDDDVRQREALTELLEAFAAARDLPITVSAFASAEAFLFDYDDNRRVDILLLDVEMGDMNGVALAKELRRRGATMPIVFITGYPDYMAQGYDVAALHYLLKPVNKDKLCEVLDKALAAVLLQPRMLLLPDGKETVQVFERDIRYAEAQGHYTVLHTGGEPLRLRMTVADFVTHGGDAFFKCGRSFAVGLHYVHRITKTTVELSDGTQLPLGKGLYDALQKALISYVRKM